MIDNGMPCVVIAASDMGITGYEDRDTLDADGAMKARIEAIRLKAGLRMNLGDIAEKSVPKMMLVSRSEEHTSELQSLMRISYAVFCLKKKKIIMIHTHSHTSIIHN